MLPALVLALLCLVSTGRSARFTQPFSFHATGQDLGQIADGVASIACGDVNQDGHLDLVLASNERGTIIQLYLNNGEGVFQRTDDLFPVTEDPNPLWNFGIVLRDFNRDEMLDIASADAWRGVNVYLNASEEGFIWSQAILVPEVNEVKGIDAGDLDGDGDDDLVFGGHNGILDRGDRVYLNDGSGHFYDSGQRIGADVTWDTVLGDMDGDGDDDYVSVNRYRINPARIHANDGNGTFGTTVDIPTTQTDDSMDVKLADLNMDGRLDIAVANGVDPEDDSTSKLFINAGGLGVELTDDRIGDPNCETKGIEVIDVTNDGYADLVLGNWNIENMIYGNDGTGHLGKLAVGIPANNTTAIATADLDGDGFIDVATGSASGGHYRVYLNDGNGLPSNQPPLPPPSLEAETNADGAALSWSPGFDHSGAELEFTDSGASIGCLNTESVAVADLNGDGSLDLLVGNGGELAQKSEAYLNDGAGNFTPVGQQFGPYSLRDVAAGDLDGDGDADWVIATMGDAVKILKNDGSGTFQIWQTVGDPALYVRAVDLGDIDDDGDLDLLSGSVGNRIYLNDGNANFSDSGQDLLDQYFTQALAFADLDHDGDLDFAQGNRMFQEYDLADRIFLNDGSGRFEDSGQVLGNWDTMDIDLGDVDGDGDFDLVAVSSHEGSNRLYLNDGTGVFTDSQQSLIVNSFGNECKAVKFGDMDHDRDLDIVIGDWNVGVVLFLNDGHGHYTQAVGPLGPGLSEDLALADFDRDGDMELLDAKKQETCNRLYLSNQAGTPQIALTYDLRLGSQPTQYDVISGVSAHGPGQLGLGLSHEIRGLESGTYYWSVRVVDSGLMRSEWSPEGQFQITLRWIYLPVIVRNMP